MEIELKECALKLGFSVIKDFLELFPSDMPDFETATSNLLPLKIHAQINVHYPTTENRLGVEVIMVQIGRGPLNLLTDWL